MAINNWREWDARILASVREQELPWYQGQAGVVDYTHALERFAVNATWLFGLEEDRDPNTGAIRPRPTGETEALIVQRGSNDGTHGSWSGVSGFIDRISTPEGRLVSQLVACTAEEEFQEEGDVSDEDLARTIWWADRHDIWPTPVGRLVLIPVVGTYHGTERPTFTPDGDEVTACNWVPLGKLREQPILAEGYLARTLTLALGSIATQDTIRTLLGI